MVAVYKQDYPAFASCSAAAALLQHCKVKRVSPLRSACCERRQLLGAAGQAQGDACSQQNRGNNFLCQQPEVEMSLFFISVSPCLYVGVSLSRFSVRLHLQFQPCLVFVSFSP